MWIGLVFLLSVVLDRIFALIVTKSTGYELPTWANIVFSTFFLIVIIVWHKFIQPCMKTCCGGCKKREQKKQRKPKSSDSSSLNSDVESSLESSSPNHRRRSDKAKAAVAELLGFSRPTTPQDSPSSKLTLFSI